MISNSETTTPPILQVRLAGAVGVAAGLAHAVAAYALRGGPRPVAGAEIALERLGTVAHESIWFGSALGAAVMPLWILGLVPVYVGLRPAGRWVATLLVLLFGYGMCVASGYHGAYVLYGSGYALHAALPEATEVAVHLGHLLKHHDNIQTIFVVPWAIASLSFVAIVLSGRTGFPRWMAITSPILVPLIVPLAGRLPAPFGGLVRPGLGSLLWTLFFALVLWWTWNGVGPRSEER